MPARRSRIRHALVVVLGNLAISTCAQADVGYYLSVYNPPTAPDQTWWGSLTMASDDYISSPTSFSPNQLRSCVIIAPDGHDCVGAVFDPRGTEPDAVTFVTDFTSQTFEFADGAFQQEGNYLALDGSGGLAIVSDVPEPVPAAMLLGGLGVIALRMRRRQRPVGAAPQSLAA